MSAKRLSGVKAVGDVDGLPELGKLVTYSMPDDPRKSTVLLRTWAKHGLDTADLPDQRAGFHIFQSACRSVETRRDGLGVEIKVDEVMHTPEECVYQITRMVRDEKKRIIEHPKAMTIAYDKTLDTITVRKLEDYDALRDVESAIRDHFTANAKTIPGQKIRNAVRDTLLKIGAQNMRRKAGGLYFVPATYRTMALNSGNVTESPTAPILEGLQGVLADLYGERGDFWYIPLIRDETAERMVAKHFAINIAEKSREVMERALQRVRLGRGDRGVRSDLIASLYNERRKLAGAAEQFRGLVSLEEKEISANFRDLDAALEQLQALADEPGGSS